MVHKLNEAALLLIDPDTVDLGQKPAEQAIQRDVDQWVETTKPQQSLIKQLGTVRGTDEELPASGTSVSKSTTFGMRISSSIGASLSVFVVHLAQRLPDQHP